MVIPTESKVNTILPHAESDHLGTTGQQQDPKEGETIKYSG
jgi:hypothetical protein